MSYLDDKAREIVEDVAQQNKKAINPERDLKIAQVYATLAVADALRQLSARMVR